MLEVVTDRLFDGDAVREGTWRIEIAGDRIARIAPHQDALGDALDARGRTVLPGLINTHVHIARGGMFEPDEPLSLGQIVRNLRDTLLSGVTSVGDMGCTALPHGRDASRSVTSRIAFALVRRAAAPEKSG